MQSCKCHYLDTAQLGQKALYYSKDIKQISLSLCGSQCEVTCFQKNGLFLLLFLFTLLWGTFLLRPMYIFKAVSIPFSAKKYVLHCLKAFECLGMKPVRLWHLGIVEDLGFGSLLSKLSKAPEMNRGCVTFQGDLNFYKLLQK